MGSNSSRECRSVFFRAEDPTKGQAVDPLYVRLLPLTPQFYPTKESVSDLYDIILKDAHVADFFRPALGQTSTLEEFYNHRVICCTKFQKTVAVPVAVEILFKDKKTGETRWKAAGYFGCRSFFADGRVSDYAELGVFLEKDARHRLLSIQIVCAACWLLVHTSSSSSPPPSFCAAAALRPSPSPPRTTSRFASAFASTSSPSTSSSPSPSRASASERENSSSTTASSTSPNVDGESKSSPPPPQQQEVASFVPNVLPLPPTIRFRTRPDNRGVIEMMTQLAACFPELGSLPIKRHDDLIVDTGPRKLRRFGLRLDDYVVRDKLVPAMARCCELLAPAVKVGNHHKSTTENNGNNHDSSNSISNNHNNNLFTSSSWVTAKTTMLPLEVRTVKLLNDASAGVSSSTHTNTLQTTAVVPQPIQTPAMDEWKKLFDEAAILLKENTCVLRGEGHTVEAIKKAFAETTGDLGEMRNFLMQQGKAQS